MSRRTANLQPTATDDDCSLRGAFDSQIRLWSRAFEHHFGSRGLEFERSNLQTVKCPRFARVGEAEVLIWSAHYYLVLSGIISGSIVCHRSRVNLCCCCFFFLMAWPDAHKISTQHLTFVERTDQMHATLSKQCGWLCALGPWHETNRMPFFVCSFRLLIEHDLRFPVKRQRVRRSDQIDLIVNFAPTWNHSKSPKLDVIEPTYFLNQT